MARVIRAQQRRGVSRDSVSEVAEYAALTRQPARRVDPFVRRDPAAESELAAVDVDIGLGLVIYGFVKAIVPRSPNISSCGARDAFCEKPLSTRAIRSFGNFSVIKYWSGSLSLSIYLPLYAPERISRRGVDIIAVQATLLAGPNSDVTICSP